MRIEPAARTALGATGLLLAGLLPLGDLAAADLDVRLKWFSTAAALPSHDIQRQLEGTPAYDYTADMRLLFDHHTGPFTWVVEHTSTINGGDSFGLASAPGTTLDQTATDDDRRLLDLTWEVEDGSRHRTVQRFDRLSLQYSGASWGFTIGRQAVSWGNGIVFQPLDLFNPFAPTTVDRDYKTGDDLIMVDKLFADGSDAQLLAVARRNEEENFTGQASSLGLKWHGFVSAGEIELVAAKHYQDQVYAVSTRVPLGGALLRADVVATNERRSDWELSAVINIDYSMLILRKNVYMYLEYYRNGFGVDNLPDSVALLPEDLLERLSRGEIFALMKDYTAAGATIEWHPLWNQTVSIITNLHDSSSLLQSQLSYEPGDRSRLDFGIVAPLGRAGDEYGGVPIAGDDVTSGGRRQAFLRFVYFF